MIMIEACTCPTVATYAHPQVQTKILKPHQMLSTKGMETPNVIDF